MTTSILEALNTDRTVADKARFVDYCVGDSIKSWWHQETGTGSPTYSVNDAVDGGYEITTAASTDSRGQLSFNRITPFSNTACSITQILTRPDAGTRVWAGFNDVADMGLGASDNAVNNSSTDKTYLGIKTGNGTTNSDADSIISINIQKNEFNIVLSSTNAVQKINGRLAVTKTTHLPSQSLEPYFYVQTLDSTANNAQMNYCEAWNT